jgi:hypothetical protein
VTFAGQVITQGCTQVVLQTLPSVTLTVSMFHPATARLQSVPRRKRSLMGCPLAEAGRLTVVVMNPAEFPVQAWRPAIGLKKFALIVPL